MSWSAMKSAARADAQERINQGQKMAEQGEAMTLNPQTPEDYEQGQRMQAEAAGISAEGQARANSIEQWQNDGHLPNVEGGGMFDDITKGVTERMDDKTRTAIDTHGVKDKAEAQHLEQNPHAELLAPEAEQSDPEQGDFHTPSTDPEQQVEDDGQTIEGTAEDITDQKAIEHTPEETPPEPEQEQSM